jgi:diaminopimelate epimerase
MRFTKMHGLGNDFLVVDERTDSRHDWPEVARRLCDRRRGVGADGILLIGTAANGGLRMRLINADGSEAEACGNGVRCVAVLAVERGLAGRRVTWETGAGPVVTTVGEDGMVTVDMGVPRFAPGDIPVDVQGADALAVDIDLPDIVVRASCVGMGNPHCVVVVDDVEQAPVGEWGPLIERHRLFPARTNVEFVAVASPYHVRQRTFERGVGETDACGTGACATVVALRRRGLVDTAVDVDLRGGTLHIDWPDDGPVLMTGPAEIVFDGEMSLQSGAGASRSETGTRPA